jgi:hypothetical protein
MEKWRKASGRARRAGALEQCRNLLAQLPDFLFNEDHGFIRRHTLDRWSPGEFTEDGRWNRLLDKWDDRNCERYLEDLVPIGS